MNMRTRFIACVLAGAVAAGLIGGCKSDSDAPKHRKLEGRITKIDPDTGVLTGKFYIKKQQEEVELSGKLAPDAEILVNGMTATLQDLRIDDSVEVTGWEEKSGESRKFVAKTIVVNRPVTTQPAGDSSTATAPADPPN